MKKTTERSIKIGAGTGLIGTGIYSLVNNIIPIVGLILIAVGVALIFWE